MLWWPHIYKGPTHIMNTIVSGLRARISGLEKECLTPPVWGKDNHKVSCWEAAHMWPCFFSFWILSDSLETNAEIL